MTDTLGLLAEACQLAADIGYAIREEPLGDLPGGPCLVGDQRQLLLNLEQGPAERLAVVLRALAADPRVATEPKSRLLAARLAAVGGEGG
jgi:hypothetical protein